MGIAEELKVQETARAVVYRRLADAFNLPSSDITTELLELETSLVSLGSGAQEDAGRLIASYRSLKDKKELKIDYARLFVGPFLALAPPYGSVYLENRRQLMGDSTVDVRGHYLHVGLDLSPTFKEAPDHISAELEFMQVLICRGIDAIDAGAQDAFANWVNHQRMFLEKHIATWAPDFTAKIIEHAQTDSYRYLARVTRTFVAEDLEMLPADNHRPALHAVTG